MRTFSVKISIPDLQAIIASKFLEQGPWEWWTQSVLVVLRS